MSVNQHLCLRAAFSVPTIVLLGLLSSISSSQAQTTWGVIDNGDSGTGTLRWAVASASNGDTIEFNLPMASVITLTSGEIAINVNLSINGPGAGNLTVSGNDSSRVFNISHGANVSINRITIANGRVTNNQGGGIRNAGQLTITDCVMRDNTVAGSSGSTARIGGAIANAATSAGPARLTVERCLIEDNSSAGDGGGIGSFTLAATTAELTVRDSTFTGNHATWGGAIAQYAQFGGSSLGEISNSTISNNASTNDGAGIDSDVLSGSGSNQLTLINTTIHGNSSSRSGGGVSSVLAGSIFRYRNTIVAGNTAAVTGNDFFQSNLGSDTVFQGGNLIGNNAGLIFFTSHSSDQIGTPGSPINPLLGPLANNGGPTPSHLPAPGSPAIDGGLNLFCPAADQRGQTRPVDGNGNGSAICDSGAVEIQSDEIVDVSMAFDPPSLDFAEVEVGGSAATLSVSLVNTGDADLSGLAFDLSDAAFAISSDDCSSGIPIGESCEVLISFAPSETGAAGANLAVSSIQGAATNLPMSGTGIILPDLIFQDRFQDLGSQGEASDFTDMQPSASSRLLTRQ
ncbi:MAG: choice-of-anchor D domain-containing protein [Wenzhouxiangella sp.]|nr:choice-of-anchor D domain-containing protein [Wenzhouxiangella sp.]